METLEPIKKTFISEPSKESVELLNANLQLLRLIFTHSRFLLSEMFTLASVNRNFRQASEYALVWRSIANEYGYSAIDVKDHEIKDRVLYTISNIQPLKIELDRLRQYFEEGSVSGRCATNFSPVSWFGATFYSPCLLGSGVSEAMMTINVCSPTPGNCTCIQTVLFPCCVGQSASVGTGIAHAAIVVGPITPYILCYLGCLASYKINKLNFEGLPHITQLKEKIAKKITLFHGKHLEPLEPLRLSMDESEIVGDFGEAMGSEPVQLVMNDNNENTPLLEGKNFGTLR
jgi:hypothetical protein